MWVSYHVPIIIETGGAIVNDLIPFLGPVIQVICGSTY